MYWLILLSVLLALMLGKILKGRWRNLSLLRLRLWPLVYLALTIQIFLFQPYFVLKEPWSVYLYLFSLILLAVFTIFNIRFSGMVLIFLGLFLNLLVISVNEGYMPVNAAALAEIGKKESAVFLQEHGTLNNVRLMGAETKLNFLGDQVLISLPQPFGAVISPGDFVLLVGLFLLVLKAVLR